MRNPVQADALANGPLAVAPSLPLERLLGRAEIVLGKGRAGVARRAENGIGKRAAR